MLTSQTLPLVCWGVHWKPIWRPKQLNGLWPMLSSPNGPMANQVVSILFVIKCILCIQIWTSFIVRQSTNIKIFPAHFVSSLYCKGLYFVVFTRWEFACKWSNNFNRLTDPLSCVCKLTLSKFECLPNRFGTNEIAMYYKSNAFRLRPSKQVLRPHQLQHKYSCGTNIFN